MADTDSIIQEKIPHGFDKGEKRALIIPTSVTSPTTRTAQYFTVHRYVLLTVDVNQSPLPSS